MSRPATPPVPWDMSSNLPFFIVRAGNLSGPCVVFEMPICKELH